jgi:ribosomal protein S18 acetylase RimI-like enzyme
MLLPESIGLRPVSERDVPLLREIYCSTREAELAQLDWTAAEKQEFLNSQFDLQHHYYQLHFPEAEFYVVTHFDQDIGRLYLDPHGEDFRLIDIALLAAWRNQGIGSGIVRGIIASANECRKPIVLHVEANNPVLSLYRRLGFQTLANNGVYTKLSRAPQPSAPETRSMNDSNADPANADPSNAH